MKIINLKIAFVFGFLFVAILMKAQKSPTIQSFRYTNPITHDFSQSMRDNMILKVGKRWYMTGTSQPIWSGQNPGVRLMVSDDLLNWRDAGWIIDAAKLPKDCPYNGRFWAPEIHQIKGKFYLIVNSGHEGPKNGTQRRDDHKIWIFSSSKIDGAYRLLTAKGLEIDKFFTNDATLFADDDGRTYLYCNGDGLYQAEIDLQSGKLLNDNNGLNGFTKINGPRDPGNPDWMYAGIEGPFVIKRHGAYWMFFSSWTRGYEVGILKGESPLGPWKLASDNPVFGTRKREFREELAKKEGFDQIQYEDTKDPYVEVGHNAVFEGPDGNDWICCHYWLKGKTIIAVDHLPLYAETREQLGIEPLHFENGQWSVKGPTWTEQEVTISQTLSFKETNKSLKLEKVWETTSGLNVCESSHSNEYDKIIYISSIVGSADEKDGVGYISKIDCNGQFIQKEWYSGLNAPKGIGCSSKSLFVADIDKVVEIDLKTGKLIKEYRTSKTKTLNDIAIATDGRVFVSENDGHCVFIVGSDSLEVFVESDQLTQMNGIYVKDKELFLGSNGNLISINRKTKQIKVVCEKTGYLDGIEQIAENKFITSNWWGKIQLIELGIGVQTLLDTSTEKINAADLGYIPSKKILLVPTFSTNTVVAYKLNSNFKR